MLQQLGTICWLVTFIPQNAWIHCRWNNFVQQGQEYSNTQKGS